jgi:hypothetical protein
MLKPGDPAWGTELTKVYAKLRYHDRKIEDTELTEDEVSALVALFQSLDWPELDVSFETVRAYSWGEDEDDEGDL